MPAGRPTDYKPEYVEQARKLCELGATDVELADFFDVSIRTIANWQAAHSEFLQALKAGKDVADNRVERSLYHKAVGYTFESEKIFQFQGEIVRTQTREHVPPSDTAMIFWLKNRRKDDWRDRQEVTGADGKDLIPPVQDDRKLARAIVEALAAAGEHADSTNQS